MTLTVNGKADTAPASGPVVLDTAFRSLLRRLDAAGRILKIGQPVSVEYEAAGLMKKYEGARAVLFETPIGYHVPIIGNLLASRANCEVGLGTDYRGLRDAVTRGIAEP